MVLVSIECKRACVSAGTWREHPAQVQPAAESGDGRFGVVVLGELAHCLSSSAQGAEGCKDHGGWGWTASSPHGVALDCPHHPEQPTRGLPPNVH